MINNFNNIDNREYLGKIVLVEDDDSILQLVSHALINVGFEVFTFNTALKALLFIEENEIDVVISDVMMPNMDGMEFCSLVKSRYNYIYFIMITAKSQFEDKIQGLEMGADDYIVKPFDIMDLILRVKSGIRITNQAQKLLEKNKELGELADRDDLTNLYNRRYFRSQVQKEIQRSKRYGYTVAILMLDIDHFKIINDTYGHVAGDNVLLDLAEVLTKMIRPSAIV